MRYAAQTLRVAFSYCGLFLGFEDVSKSNGPSNAFALMSYVLWGILSFFDFLGRVFFDIPYSGQLRPTSKRTANLVEKLAEENGGIFVAIEPDEHYVYFREDKCGGGVGTPFIVDIEGTVPTSLGHLRCVFRYGASELVEFAGCDSGLEHKKITEQTAIDIRYVVSFVSKRGQLPRPWGRMFIFDEGFRVTLSKDPRGMKDASNGKMVLPKKFINNESMK